MKKGIKYLVNHLFSRKIVSSEQIVLESLVLISWEIPITTVMRKLSSDLDGDGFGINQDVSVVKLKVVSSRRVL